MQINDCGCFEIVWEIFEGQRKKRALGFQGLCSRSVCLSITFGAARKMVSMIHICQSCSCWLWIILNDIKVILLPFGLLHPPPPFPSSLFDVFWEVPLKREKRRKYNAFLAPEIDRKLLLWNCHDKEGGKAFFFNSWIFSFCHYGGSK